MIIKDKILTAISLKENLLNTDIDKKINDIVDLIVETYNKGKKVYFCGNGGSFADAQHLAAELSGRFYFDRKPLEVVLLAANVSYLTAVGNDYGYDNIFSRELTSSLKHGDILIIFTTSGKSENIIKAIKIAKELGCSVVGFTGKDGGYVKDNIDYNLHIYSNDTARIQEVHMFLGHCILEIVENKLFKNI